MKAKILFPWSRKSFAHQVMRRVCLIALAVLVTCLGPFQTCGGEESGVPVWVRSGGRFRTAGDLGVAFCAGVYQKDWVFRRAESTSDGSTMRADGSWPFRIRHDGGTIDGEARFSTHPDGRLLAHWRAVPAENADLNGLVVVAEFHAGSWGGGAAIADGRRIELPRTVGIPHLLAGAFRRLTFVGPDGTVRFTLSFDAPQTVMLQDDRVFDGLHTLTL